MRLFLAIPLPKNTLCQLEAIQPAPEKGLRLSQVENMHLTLAFIGEGDPEQIDMALAHFNAESLELQQQGVGVFRGRKQSVLWADLAPSRGLFFLHEKLLLCLRRRNIPLYGQEKTQAKWRPHITLARSSTTTNPSAIEDFLSQPLKSTNAFKVKEFVLYNSVMEAGAVSYEVVSRYPLENPLP